MQTERQRIVEKVMLQTLEQNRIEDTTANRYTFLLGMLECLKLENPDPTLDDLLKQLSINTTLIELDVTTR